MKISVMMFVGILALALFLLFMALGKGIIGSVLWVGCNFLLGFGSLYLVNLCSGVTGFAIPVNIPTLVASGSLGLPGTLLNGAVIALAGL